jgi:hypothetical protein
MGKMSEFTDGARSTISAEERNLSIVTQRKRLSREEVT